MQKKLLTNNKSNLDAAQLMPAIAKLNKTKIHLIDKVALCVKQAQSIFLYLLIVKLDTILHLRWLRMKKLGRCQFYNQPVEYFNEQLHCKDIFRAR